MMSKRDVSGNLTYMIDRKVITSNAKEVAQQYSCGKLGL